MPRRPTLESVILIAALLADVAVLVFVREPAARLALGLLLLAPIVWSSARLGVVELVTQAPSDKVHKRRFVRLRSQVQQLLDEIRRLNWMAVDAERGFRSREAAMREMDKIEVRLKDLIEEIRSTAGRMSAEQEESGVMEGGEAKAD
ncbi:MAG: hypothetical protein GWO40_23550 [Gammaproteobacteria bacterium]|nr:hypothetical protein [Gemmatimonadota bacterium]NIU07206.1 hypothetical protein [Gammaproteobacteria bacterium]NIU54817.1 hypothetical protein [Gemmatimonadota bacterium]NIV51912.1 hypothetical protein [Gammaproteobacteria bacterium]NIW36505.1 hypothetical protein [Gemmatimonadota bacterium]